MGLLDEAGGRDPELAWAEEADRRYRELKTGAVAAIPSRQVMEVARARLKTQERRLRYGAGSVDDVALD